MNYTKRNIIQAYNIKIRTLRNVALKSYQLSDVNRKEIIPLFKHLHPDLLMEYSDDIKSKNMSCIQNINDLWDTLQFNLDSFNKKDAVDYSIIKILTQRKLVDIQHPFRETYDLTCYLRQYRNANVRDKSENNMLLHDLHTCIIKIPDSLCKKQSITFEIFENSITSILVQHGKLFQLAGMPNPWYLFSNHNTEPKATQSIFYNTKVHKQNFTKYNRRSLTENNYNSSGELGQLDSRLFDKWMIKNNQHNLANNLNVQNLQSIFGNNKITRTNMSPIEIDSYLKIGNVLITPMDATEEFKAVKHLRSFLINYADVLNFTLSRWQFVTFVLHLHNKKNSCSMKPTKDQDRNVINEKDLYQSMGFKIEQKDKHFIVTVPHLFKDKIILEFLGKYLPHAKILL